MFLLLLIQVVESLDVESIPPTGSPPSETSAAAAVYDSENKLIITFGGFDYQLNQYSSALKIFNLELKEWDEIQPQSQFRPHGLENAKMLLRNDRKLIVFFGTSSSGISCGIYSFDLIKHEWNLEKLTGDIILGREYFSFTTFVHENINYAAVYGGLTNGDFDNNLYL